LVWGFLSGRGEASPLPDLLNKSGKKPPPAKQPPEGEQGIGKARKEKTSIYDRPFFQPSEFSLSIEKGGAIKVQKAYGKIS
jgi:hypothetical protein